MSGLEPFQPDDSYCVYCHAVAAGVCATCGALCCADCVELELGWTQQRAVCRDCLRERDESPPRRGAGWGVIATLALLTALGAWILFA